ncbi:MAG: penicillin-binding transpeptidase domain-containing protein [Pseudomonadota bacterium]|nr:penicillin-binding transpeptidase domain-containing protein [Bacteroidota bacterium]MEC8882258.1 penicillin-binding transpeptidase domain-containing protein [Pseudomonadota bacterium]
MGFDAGILHDTTHPLLNYHSTDVDWLDVWKKPHHPLSWFKNSCVWYSQRVTAKLGKSRFDDYVQLLGYWNQDTSGDSGLNNGLSHCWLSSSLVISPQEQLALLNRLVSNALPVDVNAQANTKRIMFIEKLENGWDLYGKTGNCSQLDRQGKKIQDRQVGWFVGFVKKDDQVKTFVYHILDDKKYDTYASMRAKSALKLRIVGDLS